ncbi:MAG: trypsin-like serine protease [Chitinophagaceae bacterium]|nr:trypsin-like serine protease [Oligoflexus sp.]
MKHIYALACGALLFSACGKTDSHATLSIYGGRPVLNEQRLNAVALTDNNGFFCTGTAVTPTLVITAAHCTDGESPDNVRIYVGNGITGGNMQGQYAVTKFVANPLYNQADPESDHDSAYLVLKTPLDLPASAYTPILTDPVEMKELLRDGQDTYLVGFGIDKKQNAGIKNEVKAKVRKVLGSEVSLGGAGRDGCQGDSGGPAYGQLTSGEWRVYGITSRGGDCGNGGIWGLMSDNICWVAKDSGVTDLSLPAGTCPQ